MLTSSQNWLPACQPACKLAVCQQCASQGFPISSPERHQQPLALGGSHLASLVCWQRCQPAQISHIKCNSWILVTLAEPRDNRDGKWHNRNRCFGSFRGVQQRVPYRGYQKGRSKIGQHQLVPKFKANNEVSHPPRQLLGSRPVSM